MGSEMCIRDSVKILQDKNVDYELDRMLEELRKREDEKKKENEAVRR